MYQESLRLFGQWLVASGDSRRIEKNVNFWIGCPVMACSVFRVEIMRWKNSSSPASVLATNNICWPKSLRSLDARLCYNKIAWYYWLKQVVVSSFVTECPEQVHDNKTLFERLQEQKQKKQDEWDEQHQLSMLL